jgi:hypothetical protein
MMITFKQPKHVAAIYNCYIQIVRLKITFFYYLLSLSFQVFILVAIFIDSHCIQVPIEMTVAHGTKRQKWMITDYAD